MTNEIKRLFFGLEVFAPWPHELPSGRILAESHRHLTLAFLGHTSFSRLQEVLPSLPTPPFKTGLVGRFDRSLFLPKRSPHVVAWHVDWLDSGQVLTDYHNQLTQFLQVQGFKVSEYESFLPHVTICRNPAHKKEWEQSFMHLPMMTGSLHLYESLGHCNYQTIWSYSLPLPFQEIEHTADIAFLIYGTTLSQLYRHAFIALAFKFPPLIDLFEDRDIQENLEEIVISLNEVVSKADIHMGCPFKAVSFHGKVVQENNLLKWEMIIDV